MVLFNVAIVKIRVRFPLPAPNYGPPSQWEAEVELCALLARGSKPEGPPNFITEVWQSGLSRKFAKFVSGGSRAVGSNPTISSKQCPRGLTG